MPLSMRGNFGRGSICSYSKATARLMAVPLIALILVVTSAITASAAASTLYVDNGNPNCSPSGPGTQDHPFCTIAAAAGVATAGNTVLVSSGSYSGQVTPSNSGTASAPIVFAAAPGASVIITGGNYGFYVSGKSYLTVRGFRITSTSEAGIHITGSSNITLSGNHVSYAGQPASGQIKAGIRLTDTTDSLVEANTVDHNTLAGIYLNGTTTRVRVVGNHAFMNAAGYTRLAPGIDVRSSGNTVANNVSHDNEDSGLQFYTGGSNSLVVSNVAYDNGDHGIDNLNVTGQRIISNTIYNNVTAGINVEASTQSSATVENNISVDNGIQSPRTTSNIRVDSLSTSGSTVDYNLVSLRTPGTTMYIWGKTGYASLAAFRQATGQEAHGLQADPGWAAPGAGDFHLSAGSPAIDSANSAVSGEQTTDLEGNGRIDDPGTPNTGAGGRSYDDRGAYEFQGATDAPPTAVLSVSPDSGAPPLVVTADASGSTDTDATPIASYRFDFGDGAIVGPQAGATASHTFSQAGTFTVAVTVKDTAGLASTATSQVVVNQNLVGNSGFESDTAGWNTSGSGSGVTLARVSGGHSGGWAAKLTNTGTSGVTCLLNDSPNWVATTSAGSYSGSIWVRADSAGAVFNLRFREYSGASLVGTKSTQVTLTTSWQLVSVSYTPVSPGSSNLDFNAYLPAASAPPGTCFYADDAVITRA
jgi:parallel beta-helix repeat protein